MNAVCDRCNDTGSLSKDIEGDLDCACCEVATKRVMLEQWALQEKLGCNPTSLWIIYRRGLADGKVGRA